MRRLGDLASSLGATFLGVSILVLILGYYRFVQVQRWLMRGKFPASRGAVIMTALVAFGLSVATLAVVLVAQARIDRPD